MSSEAAQQNQQTFDIYNQPPAAGGQPQPGPAKPIAPPGNRPTNQSPLRTGQSPIGRPNPPTLPPKQQPPTQTPQAQSAQDQQQPDSNEGQPSSSSSQQQQSPQQGSADYSPGPPYATKTNNAPPTPTEVPLSAWRRGSSNNLRNSGSFSSASGTMPPVAPSGRFQGDSTGGTPPAKAAAAPPAHHPTTSNPPTSSTPTSQTQQPPQSVSQQGPTQSAPQQGSTSLPHPKAQPTQSPNSATTQQSTPQTQPQSAQASRLVTQQGSAQTQPIPQPTAQPGSAAQQQPRPAAPPSNSAAQPSKFTPPPSRPAPVSTPHPQNTSSPHRSPSREVATPNQTPVRNQPAENSYLQPSSPNGGKRVSIPWVTPSNDPSRNDAANECTYVTMGSMAHHVIERLDVNDNLQISPSAQHYGLVETSKMLDGMLTHHPEDLSKSGRCLHLHSPHHVTRRGEIVFAPVSGNTLESNTIPQALTSWPIPPPTPGNYGRLQSIQGQLTLVGCHRYEPDVMEELAYVDRAVSEGPNRRGYFSVERTQEALYGRTKNAYPDSGNLKYNATYFSSPSRQQQVNHAPSLVGSAVERASPFTPQRQTESLLLSPNSERNPRPPVPQNTPAHVQYPSFDTTSTPKRQTATTDGPQLVSSRTERLDRPSVASPSLYRMESSPLHY